MTDLGYIFDKDDKTIPTGEHGHIFKTECDGVHYLIEFDLKKAEKLTNFKMSFISAIMLRIMKSVTRVKVWQI